MNAARAKRASRAPETLRADVLVAGGGLTGLTLAAALADAGAECVVADPAATAGRRPDTRTTAISYGSRRIYEGIGVWKRAGRGAQPIREIRVAEGGTPCFLHFDGADADDEPLGHIVRNEALRAALGDALARCGVAVEPTAVEAIDPDGFGVRARLGDGRSVEAALVVGADGRSSRIRDLAGIGTRGREYRQSAFSCVVAHELEHNDTAVELFLPPGPFAVLPMAGKRSAIVWTVGEADAKALRELPRSRFEEELAFRFDGMFGRPRLVGRPTLHPLSLTLAKRHVSERVVLAGDAAHAIHPIAGQGFNLGLRGVALLADMVAERLRVGLDPGAWPVLRRYERRRLVDVASMVLATDGLNRLFSVRSEAVRAVRAAGLGMVHRMPRLKRRLMRHAMGAALGLAG